MSLTDILILAAVAGLCVAIAILVRKRGACTGCSQADRCKGSCCPASQEMVKDMEERLKDLDL